MRPKLLKKVLRPSRLAIGVSVGMMVGRFVVGRLEKKLEQSAALEHQLGGQATPATRKKLRFFRVVRGLLHIL